MGVMGLPQCQFCQSYFCKCLPGDEGMIHGVGWFQPEVFQFLNSRTSKTNLLIPAFYPILQIDNLQFILWFVLLVRFAKCLPVQFILLCIRYKFDLLWRILWQASSLNFKVPQPEQSCPGDQGQSSGGHDSDSQAGVAARANSNGNSIQLAGLPACFTQQFVYGWGQVTDMLSGTFQPAFLNPIVAFYKAQVATLGRGVHQ